MKEFELTQSYATIEEMLNSDEVAIYKEELSQGMVDKYAFVSRIGNRYDLNGNKIDGFADNPFLTIEPQKEDVVETTKEEKKDMKYTDIEDLIDEKIENAVYEAKLIHDEEMAKLRADFEAELAKAKEDAKAELIAKLNS